MEDLGAIALVHDVVGPEPGDLIVVDEGLPIGPQRVFAAAVLLLEVAESLQNPGGLPAETCVIGVLLE